MGRYRNPRYAPEWLERKLSPTGLTGTTTVLVATLSTSATTTTTVTPSPISTPIVTPETTTGAGGSC
jgi:hypothetical protein